MTSAYWTLPEGATY